MRDFVLGIPFRRSQNRFRDTTSENWRCFCSSLIKIDEHRFHWIFTVSNDWKIEDNAPKIDSIWIWRVCPPFKTSLAPKILHRYSNGLHQGRIQGYNFWDLWEVCQAKIQRHILRQIRRNFSIKLNSRIKEGSSALKCREASLISLIFRKYSLIFGKMIKLFILKNDKNSGKAMPSKIGKFENIWI